MRTRTTREFLIGMTWELSIEFGTALPAPNSNWSGSSWNQPPTLEPFTAAWEGGGRSEPTIRSAACLKCHVEPEGKETYAFDQPKDI
jgi:hypothetical protein